jgi:hypothetical protein
MCRIYDGKNGAAGTHGSIKFLEVQIIPHEGTTCYTPPLFTCITSLDKIKFLFINFYQFLEDWNAFAVTLFAQYEKNPIVSSCTTHHMLVLILRSCTGILSVNCVTKFLFYGWVQGNDPSCLREFLLQILSRNSPSGNVGLQVSSTNANYHTLSYTFHNIYKDCFL